MNEPPNQSLQRIAASRRPLSFIVRRRGATSGLMQGGLETGGVPNGTRSFVPPRSPQGHAPCRVSLGVPKGFRPPVRAGNRPLDCGGLVSDPVSGRTTGLASTPLLHRLPHDATARRRLRPDPLRVSAHLDGLALWRATARTVHTRGSGRTRLRPGGRAPQTGLAARRDGVSAEAESVCHGLQETLGTDRHLPSPSLKYQVDMSTAGQRGTARQPVLVV